MILVDTKFKKGHPKLGGRVKGTPNKIDAAVRSIVEKALGKSLPESIMQDIEAIDDPGHKAALKIQLMRYAYPQLKQVEFKNQDHLSDMNAEQKIEALKQAVKYLEAKVSEEE